MLCRQKEETEEKPKTPKATRRLSARFPFLKPRHKEPSVPAKVTESDAPPKIEEPAPVAPLENPAAGTETATAPTTEAPAAEEPKVVDVPPAAPQVAAAA